jgi:hypothetical protein
MFLKKSLSKFFFMVLVTISRWINDDLLSINYVNYILYKNTILQYNCSIHLNIMEVYLITNKKFIKGETQHMKKLYLLAITFVVAGLMITSATSIATKSNISNDNTAQTLMVPSKTVQSVKISNNHGAMPLSAGTIIATGDYPAFHPTLAAGTSDNIFVGADISTDGSTYYPTFLASSDGGITWPDGGYFPDSAGASNPSVDFKPLGFYATITPSVDTSGSIWIIDGTDVTALTGGTWDFSSNGFDSFINFKIACYTHAGHDAQNDTGAWNWGSLAFTGYNNYNGANTPGCPFVFYQTDDAGNGVIGWVQNSGGCVHANNDIDLVTNMSYEVYDRLVGSDYQILVRKDNMGQWTNSGSYYSHPMVSTKTLTVSGSLQCPDVIAESNIVLIVVQSDVAGNQDIICYHSSNGGSSYTPTTVSSDPADELYPTITWMKTGNAVCTYVRGSESYSKISTDGGVTWGAEARVSDETIAPVENNAHDVYGIGGDAYAIWQDGRGAVTNIYFDKFAHTAAPRIEIGTVAGGVGKVTMEVKNTGDADATNVAWSISVTGGILHKINVQTSGTIATLAAGSSVQVSTDKFIIGLGAITVGLTADQATATKTGKVILVLVKIA